MDYDIYCEALRKKYKLEIIEIKGTEDSITDNTIFINNARPKKHRMCFLIHEFGHWLMFKKYKQHSIWLPDIEKLEVVDKRTNEYRILKIEEELMAWKLGVIYTKKLGFSVEDSLFDKIKTECVLTYVK